MKSVTLALAAAALLGAAPQAQAAVTVIDFDEFAHTKPGPYGADYYTRVVSEGFEFTNSLGANTLAILAMNHVYSADPDGAALTTIYSGVTKVRRVDGALFNLLSFDFGDLSNSGAAGTMFNLTWSDGKTQSTRKLAFDGARGLQTADLNLSNLEWFTVDTQAHFDNIRVSDLAAVPEPGTWALMILGFGSAGAALRRRRNPALA